MSFGQSLRALPRRNVELPAMGLGGAALGGLHGPVPENEAAATLANAWASGLRYFDTAPLYGNGLGELITGAALRSHPRESYVLSTKTGWLLNPLQASDGGRIDGVLPYQRTADYSHDGTMRSIEASLMRLGLDRIDVAFIHDVDPYNHGANYPARFEEACSGALPALFKLRDQGVIKAVGIGVNNCDICLQFMERADLDCILLAGRYTLLDRAAEQSMLPECQRRGVGVIIGAPFNSGILASATGKFNHSGTISPDIADRLTVMSKLCADHGIGLRSAALQFPLQHRAVVSALPGVRSELQLEGLIESSRCAIPDAFWADLGALTVVDQGV